RHFIQELCGALDQYHAKSGASSFAKPHIQVQYRRLANKLQERIVSWFARPMRRKQKLSHARLKSASKGCRSRRDKAIDDRRNSPCRGTQDQARQSLNFQAANGLKHLQWIRWAGTLDSNRAFDHLNLVLEPCVVQACATPGHMRN